MSDHQKIYADMLRSLLAYDAETGVFTWRARTSNRIKVGDVAGAKSKDGYVLIRLNGTLYKAHRLAWLYVYGEWPDAEVDHINGDPGDNRICNLREATRKQNMENVKLSSSNSTGFRGVTFNKRLQKYKATMRHHTQTLNLGHFETVEEAAEVVAAKRTELFTHDHGRDRGVLHA